MNPSKRSSPPPAPFRPVPGPTGEPVHARLRRQLDRLGLNAAAAPTLEQFGALIQRVSGAYTDADRERSALESSLVTASFEMQQAYRNLEVSSGAELDRHRVELEKSLALARAVQEAVRDGILVVDERRRVVSYNHRFIEMWKIDERVVEEGTSERLVASVVGQLARPDEFLAAVERLYSHPTEEASDELLLLDGRVFDRYSGPVLSEQGSPYGRIWCFREVTERRRLEADRLVVSERMASMGRLVASVAHEINNPLAYVLTNVELLRQGLEGGPGTVAVEDLRGLLGEASMGLDRIRLLVRDLRALSHADEETRTNVDVATVLESSIQVAANQIKHRARLERDYRPTGPVRANAARLGQVFLNLLVNAAHAIPDGRATENEVTVLTRLDDDGMVRIEVRDTGVGIPPEHLDRIFDPFFTTKRIGSGTGLGLSICRGIVQAHKGTIEVRSEVGRGTAFIIRLPLAGSARVTQVVRRSELPPPMKRARVLVIDDEPSICKSLARSLGQHHDVVACQGGREALAALDAGQRFDVIFCDLMMPDLTGIDFHGLVAQKHPELLRRIVFLTGGAFTAGAGEFLEAIENPHIEKPFKLSELRRTIDRMLVEVA